MSARDEIDRNDRKLVTIFGYGSLMDESSARSTVTSLQNFRKGRLRGYKRVFNLVSISGIRSGKANIASKEMAALSIRPSLLTNSTNNDSDEVILGCLFEIDSAELPSYLEREHRYRVESVLVESFVDNQIQLVTATTVVEQSDAEYRATMTDDEWQHRIGAYYDGILWNRSDILPMRHYLKSVILAANNLGNTEWANNLLDYCVIADGKTTIREYLRLHNDWFSDFS